MAPWIDDYAEARLAPGRTREVEAHLLVCDVCFAAYLAHLLRRG